MKIMHYKPVKWTMTWNLINWTFNSSTRICASEFMPDDDSETLMIAIGVWLAARWSLNTEYKDSRSDEVLNRRDELDEDENEFVEINAFERMRIWLGVGISAEFLIITLRRLVMTALLSVK